MRTPALLAVTMFFAASLGAAETTVQTVRTSVSCPYPYSFFDPHRPQITSMSNVRYSGSSAPYHVVYGPLYSGPVYLWTGPVFFTWPLTTTINGVPYYCGGYHPALCYPATPCTTSSRCYGGPRITFKIRL